MGLQEISGLNDSELGQSLESGLYVDRFLEIFKRRYRLITCCTLLLVGVIFLRNQVLPNVYEGKFSIVVSSILDEKVVSDPSVLLRTDGATPQSNPFDIDYSTLLEVLQERGVLNAIVEDLNSQYPYLTAGYIRSGLTVERIKSESEGETTSIIEAKFFDEDPELVLAVLEKLSNTYLEFSLQERRNSLIEGIAFIENQIPDVNSRISILRDGVVEIQEEYLTDNPGSQLSHLSSRFREVSDELTAARQSLLEKRTFIESIQKQLDQSPEEALNASTLSDSPRYQQLLNQLRDVEARIAVEATRFSLDSPIITSLKAEREALVGLLNERATFSIDSSQVPNHYSDSEFQSGVRQNLSQQMLNAVNEINALSVRIPFLLETQENIQLQLQSLPVVIRRYEGIQSQLRILENQLTELQGLRETMRLESNQTENRWRLITPPQIPEDVDGNKIPISRNLANQILLALVVGLTGSFALSIFVDLKTELFYSLKDVQFFTEIPIIAEIPHFKDVKVEESRIVRSIFDNEEDGLNRIFKVVYAKLEILKESSPFRSLLITSSMKGDGKSTVAYNAAKVAAMNGRKVLLVSSSNLKGSSERILTSSSTSRDSFSEDESLSAQSQKALLSKLPVQEEADGFWMVRSNESLIQAPMITSEQINILKSELNTKFDLLIFDSNNLLESPSGLHLASIADYSLFVIGLKHSRRSKVKAVLSDPFFNSISSNVGIIVNSPI